MVNLLVGLSIVLPSIKEKNSHLEQRREQGSRGTTLIPRTHSAGHSLDDEHHPVLVTKNNFGLLTQGSACGSEMIFDLLP
jgi:hypothetical protein